MSLFESCFGDLPLEQQYKLKRTLNGINKICLLPLENEPIRLVKIGGGLNE
jgi:hypothetical protein